MSRAFRAGLEIDDAQSRLAGQLDAVGRGALEKHHLALVVAAIAPGGLERGQECRVDAIEHLDIGKRDARRPALKECSFE